MLVTRISQHSGKEHTLDLDVTQKQLDLYDSSQGFVQEIFPDLPAPEREFLKTGITPKEWENMFDPI